MADPFCGPYDRLRDHWPQRLRQVRANECDDLIACLDPELRKRIYRHIRTDEDVARFRAKLRSCVESP